MGAILAFAVDFQVVGIDIRVIGWILMAAGAAGLIFFFAFWSRRRTTAVVTERRDYDDPAGPPL
ncbi:hypothetical protein IW245_000261 [Longispora fulva]|uniref:DUF6458 domain-containing protein n=1 Tax=Longispora fulva TaxID=619741 RepID=A0A8J7KMJ0_9ACTN|nr:hypothetical protein [Longispora fulva]